MDWPSRRLIYRIPANFKIFDRIISLFDIEVAPLLVPLITNFLADENELVCFQLTRRPAY